MRGELVGARFWLHAQSVSGGLQEYIEALSFAHYLEKGTLVSYEEVQASLSDENGIVRLSLVFVKWGAQFALQFFPLPFEEYLLGVSDLTGELMRFAITAIARRGGRKKAREVSDFVRNCKAGVIASAVI